MLQPSDPSTNIPGGEALWASGGPEAEIARLRESLANAEERRRLEALLFEDKAKRVEAELDHCRSEGVVFSRLYEEQNSLVGCLRAELSEAKAERDTFKRELAEVRQELERRRSAMFPQSGAMRQVSGPLQLTSADRPGGLALTRPERGTSDPHSSLRQLSPSAESSRGNQPQTLAAVAVAAAQAQAMDMDSSRRSSGGGPTSARGVVANRSRLGDGGDQIATQSIGSSLHVNAAIGGGGGSSRTGASSSVPGGGSIGRSSGMTGSTTGEGPSSGRSWSTPSKTNPSMDQFDGVNGASSKKNSEKPVEMTITVPRALTPDEIMELSQQPQFEEPPMVSPQSALTAPRSLFALPPTSQQPYTGGKQAPAVHRQASAPYAPSVAVSSLSSADAWQNEGRFFSAGSAPPPPVRVVSTSQQTTVPKPGSATIPTAAGLAMASVSFLSSNSTAPAPSGVVPTAASQARLGVAYRR